MKQCPACGANNSSDAPSCSICGADLSQVGSNATSRTLFGMPALRVDAAAADAPAAGEPASAAQQVPQQAPALVKSPARPAAAPAALTGTRRGFRALSAVTDDHGSIGSVGSMDASMLELQQTTVGLARPQLRGGAREPQPAPTAEAEAPRSTLFGTPSPFAGQPSPASDDVILPPSMVAAQAAAAESAFEAKTVESLSPGYESVPESPADAAKMTLMGAPSPFGATSAAFEAADAADRAEGMGGIRPVVDDADDGVQSTRVRMPSVDMHASELEQEAPDYRTLVGPPQPLAEVIRARDAARAQAEEAAAQQAAAQQAAAQQAAAQQAAAPAADQYQTLVGPPQPLAEVIRARDAARQSGPAAPAPSSAGGAAKKASIIVDQAALSSEMSARDRGGHGPSVIIEQGGGHREQASVIVDEPLRRPSPPAASASPAARPSGRAPARVGARPTAVEMRADAEAERAAAARFAEAIAEEEAAVADRRRRGRLMIVAVVIIAAAVAVGVWLMGDAQASPRPAGEARAASQGDAPPPVEVSDASHSEPGPHLASERRIGHRVEAALHRP